MSTWQTGLLFYLAIGLAVAELGHGKKERFSITYFLVFFAYPVLMLYAVFTKKDEEDEKPD